MSQESVIKAVASAIWKQRVKTASKNGVDLSTDNAEFMIAANSIVDEARAAIEAYDAAKMEAEEMSETVVTDKWGREFTVRWPKSQEVKVMGIDFVVWDAVP